jgi:hypothetical protein
VNLEPTRFLFILSLKRLLQAFAFSPARLQQEFGEFKPTKDTFYFETSKAFANLSCDRVKEDSHKCFFTLCVQKTHV